MSMPTIKTDADYRVVLKDIESLMAAKAETLEGERLNVLATCVQAKERTHFPMDAPEGVE